MINGRGLNDQDEKYHMPNSSLMKIKLGPNSVCQLKPRSE